MADLPIRMVAPNIRAMLREIEQPGTGKTQTRRIFKSLRGGAWYRSIFEFGRSDTPGYDWHFRDTEKRWHDLQHEELLSLLKYQVGDRLWVRETWQGLSFGDYQPTKSRQCEIRYAATEPCADLDIEARGYPWRPSLFMPRWASRITLIVENVRVERLQDISEEDAIAEGVQRIGAEYIARGSTAWDDGPNFYTVDDGSGSLNAPTAIEVYRMLWEHINGHGSWDANPFVAAYTFRPILGNIDQIGA